MSYYYFFHPQINCHVYSMKSGCCTVLYKYFHVQHLNVYISHNSLDLRIGKLSRNRLQVTYLICRRARTRVCTCACVRVYTRIMVACVSASAVSASAVRACMHTRVFVCVYVQYILSVLQILGIHFPLFLAFINCLIKNVQKTVHYLLSNYLG